MLTQAVFQTKNLHRYIGGTYNERLPTQNVLSKLFLLKNNLIIFSSNLKYQTREGIKISFYILLSLKRWWLFSHLPVGNARGPESRSQLNHTPYQLGLKFLFIWHNVTFYFYFIVKVEILSILKAKKISNLECFIEMLG